MVHLLAIIWSITITLLLQVSLILRAWWMVIWHICEFSCLVSLLVSAWYWSDINFSYLYTNTFQYLVWYYHENYPPRVFYVDNLLQKYSGSKVHVWLPQQGALVSYGTYRQQITYTKLKPIIFSLFIIQKKECSACTSCWYQDNKFLQCIAWYRYALFVWLML